MIYDNIKLLNLEDFADIIKSLEIIKEKTFYIVI